MPRRRTEPIPLPLPPQDGTRLTNDFVGIIDPDDASSQDFDAWPTHPDIRNLVYAVISRHFNDKDPPLWIPLLNPRDHSKALHERRKSCLHCGWSDHDARYYERPLTSPHHLMNSKVGQLNDNGEASRRWQQRLIQYGPKAYSRRASRSPSSPASRSDQYHGSYRTSSVKGRSRDNPPPSDGRPERRDDRAARAKSSDGNQNPNLRHPGTFTTNCEK